ncbi:hypothetical protein XCR_0028 [Xanthomonas campestris pv. raphani 756C]|nr:hypothetical protein XCR_0028 [Xanthomonas campestris pv. raphani 756C]
MRQWRGGRRQTKVPVTSGRCAIVAKHGVIAATLPTSAAAGGSA